LPPDIDYELLQEDECSLLIKDLWQYPLTIIKAAGNYEPSLLSNYLIGICSKVNKFYNTHRVISDNDDLTKARIMLVNAARQVIKNGLQILGMKTPEQM